MKESKFKYMELPKIRPFGTQGRKPTQDLLSLYSPVDQDPRPPQVGYLKTHDFLRPLERGEKCIAKQENTVESTSMTSEKPPMTQATPSYGEHHILPGGIGTYSISHISYLHQRIPKPERKETFTVAQGSSSTDRNEETSNSSSFTGSGFTLWEESAMKKGKTGKENLAGERLSTLVKEPVVKLGQWSSERPSQSSTRRNFSPSKPLGQNQSFIEIIRPAKVSQEEEEDDEEFTLKKEISTLQGDLAVNVDSKICGQKANTPRSKHSATEQRRRSKINDRFQMLRALIPHSDQKRDKASFLLEVINYIQILQEKVHNYEGSYQGSDQEPPKVSPWKSSHIAPESHADQTLGVNDWSGPASLFPPKMEENNICASPSIPRDAASPVESDTGATTAFKGMDPHPHSGSSNKSMPLPISLPPNIFPIVGSTGSAMEVPPQRVSDTEDPSQPHSQLWQSRSCTNTPDCIPPSNKLKEQGMAIKSGTISISSIYSQGLFNTLTHALQSSGVDLSQASISVHIELGKRKNGKLTIPSSTLKSNEIPSTDRSLLRSLARSRVSSCGGDSDQAQKRLKMQKS